MSRTAGKRPPTPQRRAPQRTPSRAETPAPSRATVLMVLVVIVIMAGAGIAAFVIAGNRGDEPEPIAIAPAAVSGVALPRFETQPDPAVGSPMPIVQSSDFSGNPQSLEPTGNPQAILFLAHWCSHCQAEVPAVQDWIDGGGVPAGVDIRAVATSIDTAAPNYPPDEWLEREGWTPPVVVDIANTVGEAYGLSAFPFWVFVDGDGTVVGRTTGNVPTADLERLLSNI